MRAIVQERYGPPEDLEVREIDKPVTEDDEVLVAVRAASLHPDVWHVVTGRPYVLRLMGAGFARPRNPIPGTDMAGIVESVGKEVTRFRPGDPVFGETIVTHQWIHGGAFAEYVSVHHELLALKPENVTFAQAASVPSSGLIVLRNLRGLSQWPPATTFRVARRRTSTGSFSAGWLKPRRCRLESPGAVRAGTSVQDRRQRVEEDREAGARERLLKLDDEGGSRRRLGVAFFVREVVQFLGA